MTSSLFLQKKLEALGLSPDEASVYLILLKSKPQTVSSLARLAKINRTTIYSTIKSLEEKSLLTYVMQNKRKLIKAAPTISIDSLVVKEELEIKRKREVLETLTPAIEEFAQANSQGKSGVQVFHGQKGLIEAIDQTLSSKKDVHWIGSMKSIAKHLTEKEILNLLTWRRIDYGSVAYSLTDRWTYEHPAYGAKSSKKPFRQSKVLSEEIKYDGALGIVGDSIILYASDNTARAFVINDPMIANILRDTFTQIWKRT